MAADGFTHASNVMAEVRCSDAESATLTRALVPLNDNAPANFPLVVHVAFATVPPFPDPELSPAVVPTPSLNEYAATSPVDGAAITVGSLAVSLAVLLSPPPETTAAFVTLEGAEPETLTVSVIAE